MRALLAASHRHGADAPSSTRSGRSVYKASGKIGSQDKGRKHATQSSIKRTKRAQERRVAGLAKPTHPSGLEMPSLNTQRPGSPRLGYVTAPRFATRAKLLDHRREGVMAANEATDHALLATAGSKQRDQPQTRAVRDPEAEMVARRNSMLGGRTAEEEQRQARVDETRAKAKAAASAQRKKKEELKRLRRAEGEARQRTKEPPKARRHVAIARARMRAREKAKQLRSLGGEVPWYVGGGGAAQHARQYSAEHFS